MAQLKDLLVAGKSRFVGTTSFTDQMISLSGIRFLEGALEKKTAIYQVLGIDSSGVAVYADLTGLTIGTANKLSVSGGGTMQPVYFASGQPVTLPAFKNLTAKGPLGWVSELNDIMAVTSNTLAYWNGAYSGIASNITVLGTIQTGTWQATPIDAARGGTGQTSLINSANVLLNALTVGTATPFDNDYYISQYVNGGTTTTTYHRRPMSALWNYISEKIDTAHKYVLRAGDTMSGPLNVSYDSGTWIESCKNQKSAINITSKGYTGWISGNTKDGKMVISTYSNNDNLLYFGYMNNDTTENRLDRQMTWNGTTGVLTTSTFKGTLDGNATSATTASKLGTSAGSSTLPVYFDSGIPVACNTTLGVSITGNAATATVANKISDLTISDLTSSTTTQRYVWFSQDNNTTGRPSYSSSFTYQTSTGTLTATKFNGALVGNADTATVASKLSANAGSATRPIYFASGIPVQCNETLAVNISKNAATATVANKISDLTDSDRASSTDTERYVWFSYDNLITGRPAYTSTLTFQTSTGTLKATVFKGTLNGNASTATTASKLAVNAGEDGKPIYFTGGIPVAFTKTIGGVATPVYVNAGTITACSSTVGSTTIPVYMNGGTITASNATVGSASRPMYLNAGAMTAVTAVGTAYGGTGNTTYNANRVVYTESATKMSSTNHFASSIKMAINSTTEPATTFHVEGSANIDGEFSLDSKVKFVYNNTDKCVDIIFV